MSHSDCLGDYQNMPDEQKNLLIEALHEAHHENLEVIEGMGQAIVSLGYAMNVLAKQARKASKKETKRERGLLRVEAQLQALYRVALAQVGMTPENVKEAEKFQAIVAGLAADPNFNQSGEGTGNGEDQGTDP
jgi:hypothetical protein